MCPDGLLRCPQMRSIPHLGLTKALVSLVPTLRSNSNFYATNKRPKLQLDWGVCIVAAGHLGDGLDVYESGQAETKKISRDQNNVRKLFCSTTLLCRLSFPFNHVKTFDLCGGLSEGLIL